MGAAGLRDWLIQRMTAIFLTFYTIYIFYYVIAHPQFVYEDWLYLFSLPLMQVGTFIALLSIAFHAWVGMWTILTDYVKPMAIRYLLEGITLLALFLYVLWGIFILWGY